MAKTPSSDLDVTLESSSLAGRHFDLIISGSIAAVESVRFIRAMRRLGATVTPWLSDGAKEFITPKAVAWAAAKEPRDGFCGHLTHLAENDALIIAPATANILGKIANGILDSAEAALAQSYLGLKRPIYIMPTMHDSLFAAPAVKANIAKLKEWAEFLPAREEEGKQKFPTPEILAYEIAHRFNKQALGNKAKRILITMGTTKGFIDPVRYISNYSSGGLGSAISEELYCRGHSTCITLGPCPIKPRVYSSLDSVETNDEMTKSAQQFAAKGIDAAVFAASVLDYVPQHAAAEKMRSGSNNVTVTLVPTEKIISKITPKMPLKVGFKLETSMDEADATKIAADYMSRYQLSMMVLNRQSDLGPDKHLGYLVTKDHNMRQLAGKRQIAAAIADHLS